MKLRSTFAFLLVSLFLVAPCMAQDGGKWVFKDNRDAFTDDNRPFLMLFAEDVGIDKAVGLGVQRQIFEGKEYVFVLLKSEYEFKLLKSVRVQYRIDGNPPNTESWTVGGGTLVMPFGRDLVRQMCAGQKLIIRWQMNGTDGPTYTFDIRGLSSQLPRLGIRL